MLSIQTMIKSLTKENNQIQWTCAGSFIPTNDSNFKTYMIIHLMSNRLSNCLTL